MYQVNCMLNRKFLYHQRLSVKLIHTILYSLLTLSKIIIEKRKLKIKSLYKTDINLNGVFEDGLYLKQDNIIGNAEGIVFADNSPFKNISILGWIL